MAKISEGSRGNFKTNGKSYTKRSGLSAAEYGAILEIRENNEKAVLNGIDAALTKALYAIGLLAEGYAKKECPVDTGRLRNSITNVVQQSEKAVYIGTNVEYAECVENGTSKTEARHFLRHAAENHESQYRSVLKSCLGGK